MTKLWRQATAAALLFCSAASASINYQATSIGGGPSADVQFSFTTSSATAGILQVAIENTTPGPGRIVGFAFNVPTIDGVSFTSIGGVSAGGGVAPLATATGATVIPEVSGSQHEMGWFGKWENDGIKTPGQFGDFDFGVRNTAQGSDAFITSASGNGPSIMNKVPHQNSTVFNFAVSGTGFDTMTPEELEQAFGSALSTGNFAFALRFRNGEADVAAANGQGSGPGGGGQVPLPGAVVLGAVGLGLAGAFRKRLF